MYIWRSYIPHSSNAIDDPIRADFGQEHSGGRVRDGGVHYEIVKEQQFC
jgi:hypothetical protein